MCVLQDLTSPDIGRNPLFGFIRENSSCPVSWNLTSNSQFLSLSLEELHIHENKLKRFLLHPQKKHNLPPKFNKTLDIYTRIFSVILDDTAAPVILSSLSEKAKEVVKTSLRYLQRKMLGLKKNLKGHGSHRTDEPDELDSIQVRRRFRSVMTSEGSGERPVQKVLLKESFRRTFFSFSKMITDG